MLVWRRILGVVFPQSDEKKCREYEGYPKAKGKVDLPEAFGYFNRKRGLIVYSLESGQLDCLEERSSRRQASRIKK